ncbi:helix-turn-helix transcriptional regulator [Mucilaginibacter sp. L196]|uniref:helix-turn-helix domain-containing protein n=1 Tax=Mucilaginibacter sp. L196 TaxID=1641870 RepID=UPI00131E2B92
MTNYFAPNIKALRKRKELTQEKVADDLMIKRGTWGSYEEGRGEPHYNRLIAIARYFEVTTDDLLTQEMQ